MKKIQRIRNKNTGSYFWIIIAVVLLDQFSKWIVRINFNINDSVNLIKTLNLTYITNTGSAFGILKGANSYLIFFSLIVLGLIMFYWDKIASKEKIFFALIVGGIIGNLIDRISYGYVVDFIAFTFWPAFNAADSALTIGIVGLIFYNWKE
ncbi:TPA: signal peptidase II [Candidatus Woesearchaeota archaeon]|nr:signal peptidase II [Candidatus Woesearchaeota archaeon]